MKIKIIAIVLALPISYSGFCQTASDTMMKKDINQLEWHPKKTLPPGAMSVIAYGDPAKGHYDFYGKFPANYTVPLHWHSFNCMVVIIKGSMIIKREGFADITINEGGFFNLPPKMKYIAYTPQDCIFLVHGEEPFDIFYANPNDDPRNH